MLKLRLSFLFLVVLCVSYGQTHRIDRNEAWKFLIRNALPAVQQSAVTNCGQSDLSPGCCKWLDGIPCYVRGGNCYCDNMCWFFNDCCCDVPAAPSCEFVPSRSSSRSDRCGSESTQAPTEPLQGSPTSTTPLAPTIVEPTPLPNTCAAHMKNTGPDGCCEGNKCYIMYGIDICFCDRQCHKHGTCCSDVISNGCYPKNCTNAGRGVCCDGSGDKCRVQTSVNESCYCDHHCTERNDCCNDVSCSQVQNLSEPDVKEMENMLAAIESDNSALYEKMAAAFWRRYKKMEKKRQQRASQNRNM